MTDHELTTPAEEYAAITETVGAMIATLEILQQRNFDVDPAAATWSDVADVTRVYDLLKQAIQDATGEDLDNAVFSAMWLPQKPAAGTSADDSPTHR